MSPPPPRLWASRVTAAARRRRPGTPYSLVGQPQRSDATARAYTPGAAAAAAVAAAAHGEHVRERHVRHS